MRTCIRRCLLVLACCCLGVAAIAQDDTSAVQATQVAERVWLVQGLAALGTAANRNFISNAGFVVTGDGVVVVDALGSPALADALLAQIRSITPQPVRYVIVTHYHADHIYGLQRFKAAGAQIIAHEEAGEYIHSDTARLRLEASRQTLAPWIDGSTHLVEPDVWMKGREWTLHVGGFDFAIRHVGPAHTPEDLAVFVPKLGVLFAGDLLFRGRVPYVGQADSRLWIQSLEQLMALRPSVVIAGHGPASTAPLQDMALTRDYLLYLRKTMGEAAHNMEPFDEAYSRTDWSQFDQLPLFKMANRMNAYNTYLLMEQQVEK